MQTSNSDNLRSFVFSTLLHAGVFGLLTLSVWWTRKEIQVAIPGPIIEATLVGAPRSAPPPKPTKPAPKPVEPKPVEEKPKVDEPTPEPRKEDRKDQEKITDKIALEKAAADAKVQDELRKKEQFELTEKLAKAEAEKKRKLEEEKLKQQKEMKARELAKAKKDEARYMEQLMQGEEARSGQEGQDESLEAEYYAAIQSAVTLKWMRPEGTPPGIRCTLEIIQIIGGEVTQAVVVSPCNADELTRRSLEQAPMAASPLPYAGYETVFKRKIRFEFTYDG
ncbi:cell envelope integrity protein TolA [Tahibacter amnicola]|uniref:Cell division and transport-associated protein TolA n=1 Tax=Tahibacter amnicola TaxID=2976241 RepID=A0ABY6BC99_9GAMM|nr:cell envelope integrity protein TolA [Tahibacter amnicola]UXI67668.1 hypothetical protein N4264_23485 [Tahibacter amnicola]